MVYSFRKNAALNRAAYAVILGFVGLVCTACGVRGPLTVNPKPIKGLDGIAAPAPADLRAAPASAVLYGSDGKQTIILAPLTTQPASPVSPAVPGKN
jgi:hypothetical protein